MSLLLMPGKAEQEHWSVTGEVHPRWSAVGFGDGNSVANPQPDHVFKCRAAARRKGVFITKRHLQ